MPTHAPLVGPGGRDGRLGSRGLRLALGCLALLALAPAAPAAAADMTLGPVVRTALPGCDAPTPVRAPAGSVYSNVSDCSPAGSRLSTGWVRLAPSQAFVRGPVTTTGSGANGPKMASALVEGSTLYLLERNVPGGTRLGVSTSVDNPAPTWKGTLGFGWASFAQASPDGYEYVYLRDSRSAYGSADRVDLARAPKGRVADLAAWQIYGGSGAWLPWSRRDARAAVLTDPGRVWRPHTSHLGACWVMAVTMPSTSGAPGNGLAVYTSVNPYGPWNRRYNAAGVDLGESAQFSPIWPGELLTSEGDRFTWRRYAMPGGC